MTTYRTASLGAIFIVFCLTINFEGLLKRYLIMSLQIEFVWNFCVRKMPFVLYLYNFRRFTTIPALAVYRSWVCIMYVCMYVRMFCMSVWVGCCVVPERGRIQPKCRTVLWRSWTVDASSNAIVHRIPPRKRNPRSRRNDSIGWLAELRLFQERKKKTRAIARCCCFDAAFAAGGFALLLVVWFVVLKLYLRSEYWNSASALVTLGASATGTKLKH